MSLKGTFQFAVPRSGGVTPPKGGTTNFDHQVSISFSLEKQHSSDFEIVIILNKLTQRTRRS